MLDNVRAACPDARIEGLTVQPMADTRGAYELIVGVVDDPLFGPVILFGQGGTAVEVVGDQALALPPLNLHLAHELMRATRIFRLLQGYRDWPPAALDEIALTLVKVSQMVADLDQVAELDINPLLAGGPPAALLLGIPHALARALRAPDADRLRARDGAGRDRARDGSGGVALRRGMACRRPGPRARRVRGAG